MNEMNEYQEAAKRTMKVVPGAEDGHFAIYGLGLAGESGEVIEHIKKYIGHGHPLDVAIMRKELGDVLWYVSALATLCNLSLADVAAANIAKLQARYPDGFTPERSRERGTT